MSLPRCRSCIHLWAWLVVVAAIGDAVTCQATQADPDGFVSIFNGTSLDGWEGMPEFWRVEDGAIVGETTVEKPTKGNTFLIWRQGLVDDFELVLQYRLTGGNSGIQYRSRDNGGFVVGGYQGDFESGPSYSGILYEERGRGILAKRGERMTILTDGTKKAGEPIGATADLQKLIKPDGWNEFRIIAHGPKLQHFINGQLMSETIDEQAGKRSLQGVLALQLHAGPPMKVAFKDIRLKRLKLAQGRKKLVMVAGQPGNAPTVRANKGGREVLAWASERPQGGRGFGCTGAHFHKNWENDDFRKLMLNALVWTSGLDVPMDGVSSSLAAADVAANLDDKQPNK